MFNIKVPFVVSTHVKKFSGTTNISNKSKAAGLGVDTADSSKLKWNQAGTIRKVVSEDGTATLTNKTISNPSIVAVAPVAFASGTSLALTQALHANRIVYVTDVAAAYTLPAATGTGDKYTIILGATQTGAGTISVNATPGTDVMKGTALLFADGGDTVVGFATAADSDTVDLFETNNTTGGMIGAIYEFWDVATGIWAVRIVSDAGGTEATPFSAAV